MKKLFIIICALFVGIANADNVITSKEYVDAAGATLQPQVQAKNANTVLTYPAAGTETPGEKAIYDASAAYATQSDALVTAGEFNNALQVALDTEFVCVSRNDQGCLLYEIRAGTPKSASKNLFDVNSAKIIHKTHNAIQVTKTSTGYSLMKTNGAPFQFILVEIGDINDLVGKKLTVSFNASCTNSADPVVLMGLSNDDGSQRTAQGAATLLVKPEAGRTKVVIWLYASASNNEPPAGTICTYSNIQVEEGETATAYEPYRNLYLPSGN